MKLWKDLCWNVRYYWDRLRHLKLYCDNKEALQNAFKPIKGGITPYINLDHDLIEL